MNRSNAVERKQTENEYQPTQVRRPGQRLLHLGNWEWNLETKKYSWCDEMYRIFKLSPQQSPPRTGTFFNCVHPEDREKVVKALGRALVGGQPYNIEHRIVWPDGSVRFVQGKAEVTFDQVGRPRRVLGTIQDITALRQAAAALQE